MTFLAHALALSALHGPGPWPDDGHPLPDEEPRRNDGDPFMPGVVMDGIRTHHFGVRPGTEAAAEIADLIVQAPADDLTGLHDRLAGQPAMDIADDLVQELGRRHPPRDRLRVVARHLAEHGTGRNTVKIGIVLLGVCGGEEDRDLLLLLGTLDELTLYAVVALMRTQPDRQRAAYELARRVGGWGRIHAVERLKDCDDPEIKAWLLREGFRNGVMDEYLAHLAATTGDLYSALLEPQVDDALLDGAGGILAALAIGGPAQDMSDYPEAAPAMDRYAELIARADPTLDRLTDVLTIARYVQEPEGLVARYGALLARPIWRSLVLAHLAHPVGPYGFNKALSCAARLGIDALPQALAHLEGDPFANFVWHWALRHADATNVTAVIEHAERLLPLEGANRKLADRRLEVLVNGLDQHPGKGLPIIGTALAHPIVRVRRRALKTLLAWPPEALPQEGIDLVTAAAEREPDDELRSEMTAFISR